MKHFEQSATPHFPKLDGLFHDAFSMLGRSGRWYDTAKKTEAKPGPCSDWKLNSASPDLDQVAALARLLSVPTKSPQQLVESLFAPFSVTVIETGQATWNLAVEQALVEGLLPAIRNKYDYLPKISVLSPEPKPTKSRLRRVHKDFEEEIQDALTSRQPVLLVVDSSHSLPDSVFRSVTNWMPITSLSWPLVKGLHEILHDGSAKIDGAQPNQSFSEFGSVEDLPPKTLALALRHRDFNDVIAEVHDSFLCKPVKVNQNALNDVKGLGQSRKLLEQLAADVSSWSRDTLEWASIPQGVLFYGPPGTGKTYAASKLAEQMGAHFVSTSYAGWQKMGHLGDFMKAMKSSFDKARENAPSVLFIDEIDSFGDRATAKGDNADYVRSAINALLEQLDGAEKNDGVLVVAACNNYEKLDAALVRSGRFDNKIYLGLPAKSTFSEIISELVGVTIQSSTIEKVSAHLVGQTGADAAAVVRSAGSLARSSGRNLSDNDLLQAALQLAPMSSDADLRRAAIHEAGHAVAGYLLGRGVPIRAEIKAQGGSVTFAPVETFPTASNLEATICTALAGRVAEQAFFGDVSAGSGGGEESDLATATLLSAQMELQFGFGARPLLWQSVDKENLGSILSDSNVAKAVNQRLENAKKQTTATLTESRNMVLKLATLLIEQRQIGKDELASFFSQNNETNTVQYFEKTNAMQS
ncbi:hypothetical protein CSC82_04825 [Rhodobacteraceae bacterium 4F10]|nr:hypothetical protein CSC82_04825 [Rhodobacteraceae bacterium 4F10]